jgi:hypothetical protein
MIIEGKPATRIDAHGSDFFTGCKDICAGRPDETADGSFDTYHERCYEIKPVYWGSRYRSAERRLEASTPIT